MSTGPKKVQGRGGPGRGQGRKPYKDRNIPESIKKSFVVAIEQAKKNHDGRSLGDLLMQIAYGDITGSGTQVNAIKLALEYVAGKESKQEITVKHEQEPAVYLPEEKPDPAKSADILKLVQ